MFWPRITIYPSLPLAFTPYVCFDGLFPFLFSRLFLFSPTSLLDYLLILFSLSLPRLSAPHTLTHPHTPSHSLTHSLTSSSPAARRPLRAASSRRRARAHRARSPRADAVQCARRLVPRSRVGRAAVCDMGPQMARGMRINHQLRMFET